MPRGIPKIPKKRRAKVKAAPILRASIPSKQTAVDSRAQVIGALAIVLSDVAAAVTHLGTSAIQAPNYQDTESHQ